MAPMPKEFNARAKIVILPTDVKPTYSISEQKKIRAVVRDRVLVPSKEPYRKAVVSVAYGRGGAPQSLLVFLLRAYTYTADIARINLDSKYKAKSVTYLSGEDVEEVGLAASRDTARRPRKARAVDMVFATPEAGEPTARAAVEFAYNLATRLGYTAVKLIGTSANVANYKRYLTSGVKAFGSVGHGYTGGIILSDGNLTSIWLNGLASGAISPAVVYLNSCEVFNAPFLPAIMHAGARTFVGGKVRLLIGRSEEVFKCFWTKVLEEHKKMKPSLVNCESQHYPITDAHGTAGDFGTF
jgi:hypothetical protein